MSSVNFKISKLFLFVQCFLMWMQQYYSQVKLKKNSAALLVVFNENCTYRHLFPCVQVFSSLCFLMVASSNQLEKIGRLYYLLTADTSVSAWVAGANSIQKGA